MDVIRAIPLKQNVALGRNHSFVDAQCEELAEVSFADVGHGGELGN